MVDQNKRKSHLYLDDGQLLQFVKKEKYKN